MHVNSVSTCGQCVTGAGTVCLYTIFSCNYHRFPNTVRCYKLRDVSLPVGSQTELH